VVIHHLLIKNVKYLQTIVFSVATMNLFYLAKRSRSISQLGQL